jgi:hypothetical protein
MAWKATDQASEKPENGAEHPRGNRSLNLNVLVGAPARLRLSGHNRGNAILASAIAWVQELANTSRNLVPSRT